MALRPDLVGQRVVVRQVVPGETGPSGGPALTDVLGELVAWTTNELTIRRKDDTLVIVQQSLVVTAKPVPPKPSVRQRISPEDLQLVADAGWRPTTEERLGDWRLRAAGGFTGRANSVLPVGTPGLPAADAIEHVVDFYRRHELPALAQVIVGSDAEAAFVERGWFPARPSEPDALVQVASVAQALRHAPAVADDAPTVALLDEPDDDWVRQYRRAGDHDAGTVRAVLIGGPTAKGFARVGDPALAIGRAVVVGDWVGLSAVEVDPDHRGAGLAHLVVQHLLDWAASHGAMSAYLQTLPSNEAGLALYARYGFETHHRYRYLTT